MAFPDIHPIAFSLGPFVIRWYALAYIAGILLGWLYARHLVSKNNLWKNTSPMSKTDIDDFITYATLGIILGGRLGYVIFYNPAYFMEYPSAILAVWEGGMSFHGGLTGVIIAMILFARSRSIQVLSLFDVIGAAAPIGLFFGRIANFINGELWGRVTEVSWGVVFPAAGPLPRHPSQLYEAALEGLALFLICALLIRFKALHKPGLVAAVFAAGYGLARFAVEFVRDPDPQIGLIAGFFTMGQLLSIPMILAGFALAAYALKTTRSS
jgi:phosphatidylglycerol:prolipoprotein diacylglycerol transferase